MVFLDMLYTVDALPSRLLRTSETLSRRTTQSTKSLKITINLSFETETKKWKKKLLCIIRESNTGLIDGNDEFYH